MAKIYERLLFTNILREKRRDLFDPERKNLLRQVSICMVNLLEIPQIIVFFSYYMIDLLGLIQKKSFVLSSEHEKWKIRQKVNLLSRIIVILRSPCRAIMTSLCVSFVRMCSKPLFEAYCYVNEDRLYNTGECHEHPLPDECRSICLLTYGV